MDSIPWAFPLVYFHWFTGSTEKIEAKWREECCVLFYFLYSFSLKIVSWSEEEVQGGASLLGGTWHRFGRKCSSWNQEVSWSQPSGFTACLQDVALAAAASSLHHYISKEPIHRKEFSYPSVFNLLLSKENVSKFQMDVLGFRNTRRAIKVVFLHILSLLSNCSLWSGSVYTSSLPAQIIYFACDYIDIV